MRNMGIDIARSWRGGRLRALLLAGCLVAVAAPGRAGMVALVFDGLIDGEGAGSYFNGGYGTNGSGPGPLLGIEVLGGTVSVAPGAVATELTGTLILLNFLRGFDTGLSIAYRNTAGSSEIRVFGAADGHGPVLASLLLAPTAPDGTAQMAGLEFSGTAYSVAFVSRSTGPLYVSSPVFLPADTGTASPEPATVALALPALLLFMTFAHCGEGAAGGQMA
jgi:hypothetical protein